MAACVSQRRDDEINKSGLTMVPRGYLRANLLMKDPASEHLISSDKSAKPIFRALQKIFNRLCASRLTPPPVPPRLPASSTGRTGRAAETVQKTSRCFREARAVKCTVYVLQHHLYFREVSAARYSAFSFTRSFSDQHATAASLTLHSSALLARRFPFHETSAVMHIKDIACM